MKKMVLVEDPKHPVLMIEVYDKLQKVDSLQKEKIQLENDLAHAERQRDELLAVCKMAHRKHSWGDDSVGWEELSEMLAETLAGVMGNEEYLKFQEGWIKE